jgi:hypothetical protein
LCIRNGKLVQAGVGISLWRRPGDVVARFTSTLQRVGFTLDALSQERLPVRIEGFILWSVATEAGAPFRAFQKLGLVNLSAAPRDLKSPKHLLSTPQHRAFQQLIGAAVQRLASSRTLQQLLLEQDALMRDFRTQLAPMEHDMGIRIDQVDLVRVRPADEELLRALSSKLEEQLREEASQSQLESTERAQRRAIESETRIAHERVEARKLRLASEKVLRLAQIADERELSGQQQQLEHERALALEASARELAKAVLKRDELLLEARLQTVRREAETNAASTSLLANVEEQKSLALREHELARLVAEKVGDALKQLPIHDARWITVGPDSPATSFAALIGAARELTSAAGNRAG